jgi:hypothetical protein
MNEEVKNNDASIISTDSSKLMSYQPRKRQTKPGDKKRGRKPAKDDDYEAEGLKKIIQWEEELKGAIL